MPSCSLTISLTTPNRMDRSINLLMRNDLHLLSPWNRTIFIGTIGTMAPLTPMETSKGSIIYSEMDEFYFNNNKMFIFEF